MSVDAEIAHAQMADARTRLRAMGPLFNHTHELPSEWLTPNMAARLIEDRALRRGYEIACQIWLDIVNRQTGVGDEP